MTYKKIVRDIKRVVECNHPSMGESKVAPGVYVCEDCGLAYQAAPADDDDDPEPADEAQG